MTHLSSAFCDSEQQEFTSVWILQGVRCARMVCNTEIIALQVYTKKKKKTKTSIMKWMKHRLPCFWNLVTWSVIFFGSAHLSVDLTWLYLIADQINVRTWNMILIFFGSQGMCLPRKHFHTVTPASTFLTKQAPWTLRLGSRISEWSFFELCAFKLQSEKKTLMPPSWSFVSVKLASCDERCIISSSKQQTV